MENCVWKKFVGSNIILYGMKVHWSCQYYWQYRIWSAIHMGGLWRTCLLWRSPRRVVCPQHIRSRRSVFCGIHLLFRECYTLTLHEHWWHRRYNWLERYTFPSPNGFDFRSTSYETPHFLIIISNNSLPPSFPGSVFCPSNSFRMFWITISIQSLYKPRK